MLTRDDVELLLRDDSPDSRSAILEKVATSYNANALNAREQEIAEYIFRLLTKDLSTRVRAILAERIKDNANVPRDIVLQLANDIESVAAPVLRDSAVLSDADLISIVEASQDMGKLLAVSQRKVISERVSGALVGTTYEAVVTSLLGNAGANISTTDLSKIATDFSQNASVLEALIAKPNLPVTVLERIIARASHAVASELKQKYNLSEETVKHDTNRARETLMLRLLEGDLGNGEMQDLVNQMWREGTLSPSILMTALCRGQLLFFTMGLSKMANVPLANAVKLVNDRGVHGFNGIYQKSGLPQSMMEGMRIVMRAVQEMQGEHEIIGSMRYANRLAERVVNAVGDMHVEYIPYFLALIRQQTRR